MEAAAVAAIEGAIGESLGALTGDLTIITAGAETSVSEWNGLLRTSAATEGGSDSESIETVKVINLKAHENLAEILKARDRATRYLPQISLNIDFETLKSAFVQKQVRAQFVFSVEFDVDRLLAAHASGLFVMGRAASVCPRVQWESWLIKIHAERCVLDLGSETLHLSKSTKRRLRRLASAGGYQLVVDSNEKNFRRCLDQCIKAHEDEGVWIHNGLRLLWIAWWKRGQNQSEDAKLSCSLHSAELCDRNGKMVAGEIGVLTGGVWTSLTGWHSDSDTGTAQLVCLEMWLKNTGNPKCKTDAVDGSDIKVAPATRLLLWDMGMPIDYKLKLGFERVSRAQFFSLFDRRRELVMMMPERGREIKLEDAIANCT